RERHEFVFRAVLLISEPTPKPQPRKQPFDPPVILYPVLDFLPHFIFPAARPALPAHHLFIRNQAPGSPSTRSSSSRFPRRRRRPFSTNPQNRLHPLQVPRTGVVQRVFLVCRTGALGPELPQPPEQPR